jgi:spore coat protein U-like protein
LNELFYFKFSRFMYGAVCQKGRLNMRRALRWLVVFVGMSQAAVSWPCLAATSTTTFNVQITITNACSIVSATNLNFGTVGVIGALGVDATNTITVQCTLLAPYNIGLNAGLGAGATVANRLMTSAAAQTVAYSLYQDLTHLLVWGNTIGTDTVAGLGLGLAQPYTVYGHVPSQTTPAAGVYNDTITVTVTF